MPDTPDHRDLWHELNQARLDIAELRGMLSMHFSEGQHHYPPCKPAADLQKTMLSSLAAALIALLAAVGTGGGADRASRGGGQYHHGIHTEVKSERHSDPGARGRGGTQGI